MGWYIGHHWAHYWFGEIGGSCAQTKEGSGGEDGWIRPRVGKSDYLTKYCIQRTIHKVHRHERYSKKQQRYWLDLWKRCLATWYLLPVGPGRRGTKKKDEPKVKHGELYQEQEVDMPKNPGFSKGIMNPSSIEPDLIEKPPDFILSPVIEQQSGRRSSNHLALNSLSRKSKDINGLQVGGKGHTTFVKLNLDDFVNESIANTFPKNSISPVTGDGKPNRVEEEGPARDDFGIIMSDNGVAIAIDTHGDREPEQIPQSDSEGMAVPAHVLNSGNHLLNPSSLNVCPLNTNVSAPPSPFKPVSGVFSPEGNGMGNIIVNDSSQSQVRPTVTKLNLIDANRSEPRKVPVTLFPLPIWPTL
ncbi:hypothetical protein L1987_82144 [Smallanthus sonchifolius]|uniref:Uncharacterized protein n=1 Tax=Smallanthus sonchifolius TaxID=185202 RepID=A0ACB8YSK7_9ASTR|nr:hypothetical protein L1987_82144 [Smallanthus sonchifolius]